jgi:hypothetical protein
MSQGLFDRKNTATYFSFEESVFSTMPKHWRVRETGISITPALAPLNPERLFNWGVSVAEVCSRYVNAGA